MTERWAGDPFGEVLPETTRDETGYDEYGHDEYGRGWGDSDERDPDDWLRSQVPPHHD